MDKNKIKQIIAREALIILAVLLGMVIINAIDADFWGHFILFYGLTRFTVWACRGIKRSWRKGKENQRPVWRGILAIVFLIGVIPAFLLAFAVAIAGPTKDSILFRLIFIVSPFLLVIFAIFLLKFRSRTNKTEDGGGIN